MQKLLKMGEWVLYPTDTIWGLGCDPNNEEAIEKINKIKHRLSDKNYILLVSEEKHLNYYIPEIPEVCYDLMDFSERPLTIVFPGAKNVSKSLIKEDNTLGIRMTKDEFCKKLCQSLKGGIVSTSANISGKTNPSCFDEIDESIKNSVDYIVNLRKNETMKKPSSIVKIGLSGEVEVIRK